MKSIDQFKHYLENSNKSALTIKTYISVMKYFEASDYNYSLQSLQQWRLFLISNYSTATTNLRLQVMNKFLEFNHIKYRLKTIAVQPQNIISKQLTLSQYNHILKYLINKKNYEWYVIIRLLATTGVRISEAYQITWEDIRRGYCDIIGKGTKARRIWISRRVSKDLLRFRKSNAAVILYSSSYIRVKFKQIARECNIPIEVFHPHELRAFYAKRVYEKTKDIRLVQNLLGHSNVTITMRYLRETSDDIQKQLSRVIDW